MQASNFINSRRANTTSPIFEAARSVWQPIFQKPLAFIAIVTALLLTALDVSALPSDRQEEIKISADSATYQDNRGIYTGNVILIQGSLRIQADRLIINQANRKVSDVIATGRPARFQQQPKSNTGTVTASAKTIRYEVGANEIILTESAYIVHKGSEISSERIVYNAAKESVLADGQNKPGGSGRVNMVLQPSSANLK